MITRQKQPSEKLVYDFDFSYEGGIDELYAIQSVTSIASVTCGIVNQSLALSLGVPAFQGRVAQVTISGGTHGESYKLTAIVVDTVGQIHELEGFLEVINL